MLNDFWFRLFPWRFLIRRLALKHGLVDPIALFSKLSRFAQPSEVAAPFELLRAALVFHGRGLLNTRTIQNNLDWIWPYWVVRQFDPLDDAFVPRAFSITHVNLTQRNWTAVGLPEYEDVGIVDPRGLLTPYWDSWSIDAWVVEEGKEALIPAFLPTAEQELLLDPIPAVTTRSNRDGCSLQTSIFVELDQQGPLIHMTLKAASTRPGSLAVSLRPYNAEGVSLIHRIELSEDHHGWLVNRGVLVHFDQKFDFTIFSRYKIGDAYLLIPLAESVREQHSIECDVGMATAVGLFALDSGGQRSIELVLPLRPPTISEQFAKTIFPARLRGKTKGIRERGSFDETEAQWNSYLQQAPTLRCPDEKALFLYQSALRTLLLLSSEQQVFPGPFTYKRFWFRDAAFILHALLAVNMGKRVAQVIEHFPSRQARDGYFVSQRGEWDANGEALWIINRCMELSRFSPSKQLLRAVEKGAAWIARKRAQSIAATAPNELHHGLLPAGFSAEHFGPNDYYYWDDFWGIAGLNAAAGILSCAGRESAASDLLAESSRFLRDIELSIEHANAKQDNLRIPASPYRRMDAGAIGSLAADYPLLLFPPADPRILNTVEYLLANCFVHNAFFQDMIHSGLNAYLTLHTAQALMRAGDPRYGAMYDAVKELASPTGQWPEAIHPRTLGGCMGDGQHAWAAAEWILFIRNMFVREESDGLVFCAGISKGWLEAAQPLTFGPTPTRYGTVTVQVDPQSSRTDVSWIADWKGKIPQIRVSFPGSSPTAVDGSATSVTVHNPG